MQAKRWYKILFINYLFVAKDFKLEIFFESTKPEVEQEHEQRMAAIDEEIRRKEMERKPEDSQRRSIDVGKVDASHNSRELVKKLEEYKDMIDVDDSEDEDDNVSVSGKTPVVSASPAVTDSSNAGKKNTGLFSSFFN